MSDQKIVCPHCQHTISVTASLTAQLREEFVIEFRKKEQLAKAELMKQQQEIEQKEKALELDKKFVEEKISSEVQKEKQKIWAMAQQKAKEKIEQEHGAKFKELEEENKQKSEELKKAQELELTLRKKSREIEERAEQIELEITRKLDEERKKIAEQSKKIADEEHRFKLLEKDKQLDVMRQQIEDLKRKSEQGSMQIQGEVQEDSLKELLISQFPSDKITDVEKGIKGADVVQVVKNQFGQRAGIILWESKNTKSWKDEWVTKLKEDQHRVEADICVIVSNILPKGADTFTQIRNVWIVKIESVVLLTFALRSQLLQLSRLKQSLDGREEKMAVLYQYISGAQFKNRVENIVTAFSCMKEDLEKEKRAFERIWKKREQEIERVISNTAGMYGDLQGMIGASLPAVSSLELPEAIGQDGLFEDSKPEK